MIKVIDLFSGVGGMSLGAAKAGFTVSGAVELDPIAIKTHAINFPKTKHLNFDISKLTGADLLETFNITRGEAVGIIGGPPCQGFSYMGKQDINDPRNFLFLHFFRLINEIRPSFFVAENVPGILDKKYDQLRNNAFALVEKHYDLLPHSTINAKEVGAPTTRTRVFFIGINKLISSQLTSLPIFGTKTQTKQYNVQDALFGLPEVVDDRTDYWLDYNSNEGTYSDILSRLIPDGVGNETAISNWINLKINGMIGTKHTEEVINRFKQVPPGSIDKISRAPRLKADGFCPTLRAGTGSDKGSYQAVRPIHPSEDRVITPREAARLQGFPDWFQFHHTKWHSFRQIGNSVSPIVSEYIFSRLIKHLT
ncbi:DNA cytosine methyltransferase [Brevibacillus brevis]|nr:DNA cytosine methyltransferase [Brevibacillus brevis]